MMYLLWLLIFPFNFAIYLACMILNPVAALFVTKRNGREYLVKPLYWFQTHDNPVDEYWHGGYVTDSFFRYVREATPYQYESSAWLRYVCRLFWLWRNCAYGFSYNLFGVPLHYIDEVTEHGMEASGLWWRYTDRINSWQWKAHIPVCFGLRLDLNIGWKTHKNFPKAMYASRIFALRKDT